jgi:transglutaminase-like putative cysteine protease
MPYRLPTLLLSLALLVMMSASAALAVEDAPPSWLQQAATANIPSYNKDVPAVVLYSEQVVTIAPDGRITTTKNYAVRILTRDGREYANAVQMYLTGSSKVRDMRAWLIRGSGDVKKYGKENTLDQISDPNDIYNEYRVRIITAERDADAGMVFGYQSTIEEAPLFGQDLWRFQSRLPTLVSRYTLALPAGWRASSVTFNHAKIEPSVTAGSTYTWELTGLPPIELEPRSPEVTNLAPRIAVNYFPPDGSPVTGTKTFTNWADVSRWATELNDPQTAMDDTLAAKARELTASSKTELERIQAVARFVQNLQYISIDIGVGRGNGYRPRPAAQVLAKAYGDCKDKANLMRTLLKALRITAYPVAIYSGDPTFVREEWASPSQFNHAIIAIKVSDETQVPTVINHPKLGRLLIFDATDESTMVGDLPEHEQGSLALVVAGDDGLLIRMPTTPPESNQLERQIEATLADDGSITGSIQERSMGQSAVDERRAFNHFSRPDYLKIIEMWVTRGVSGARVTRVEPVDGKVNGRFALDVEFSAASYAQLMQNRLLVFKPAIVSRRDALVLTQAARKYPIVIDSNAFTETVRVKLPQGFGVDEMPDPLKLDTPFGNYTASYDVKDGQLLFTRKLTMRAMTIPAADYAAVRSFFERIRAVEQSPVVLARQ